MFFPARFHLVSKYCLTTRIFTHSAGQLHSTDTSPPLLLSPLPSPRLQAMFEVFAHNLQDANLNVVGFTLTTLAVITEELERAGLPLFQKLLPLIMAAVQA